MRLIDADALPRKYIKIQTNDQDPIIGWYEHKTICVVTEDSLEHAPTIDAVPVVRCGECKYLMANGICNMFADDTIKPSASDFCSCGERKDNE